MAMPSRSAGIQSKFGIFAPGGRAVLRENDVGVLARQRQIRQHAVRAADMNAAIRELQLLGGIGHPFLAEAFPGEDVDRARAQHRPHDHLDGAGVGRRHDRDLEISRNAQHRAGAVDGLFELGFPGFGAV